MKLKWSISKDLRGVDEYVAKAGEVELCVVFQAASENNDGSEGWWWYLDGMSESEEDNYAYVATKEEAMETAEAFLENSVKEILKSFGYTI